MEPLIMKHIPQSLVQNSFLESQRQAHTPVSIYLMSGIRLQGTIADFDMKVVLLKSDAYQLIYKTAIASIVPGSLTNSIKRPRQISHRESLALDSDLLEGSL